MIQPTSNYFGYNRTDALATSAKNAPAPEPSHENGDRLSSSNSQALRDALAAPKKTVPWFGVRNYQARNLMRDQMQIGDGVLFYHSNADPPAIAGVAEVVETGRPDPTAFDPDAEHYDPKSDPASRSPS